MSSQVSESQRLSDKGICVAENSSPRGNRGSNICVTQAEASKTCIPKSPICTLAYSIIITEPWLLLCLQETRTKACGCFPSCSAVSVYKERNHHSIWSKMLCATSRKWENGWWCYAADQDQWKHNAQQNIHPQSHKGINNLHEIKIHNNVKLK